MPRDTYTRLAILTNIAGSALTGRLNASIRPSCWLKSSVPGSAVKIIIARKKFSADDRKNEPQETKLH